jgi:hypothetical protein
LIERTNDCVWRGNFPSVFDLRLFRFLFFFLFLFSRVRCARGFVLCVFSHRQTSSPFPTFGENEFTQIITSEKKEMGAREGTDGFFCHMGDISSWAANSLTIGYGRLGWETGRRRRERRVRSRLLVSFPVQNVSIFIKEIRYCVSLS